MFQHGFAWEEFEGEQGFGFSGGKGSSEDFGHGGKGRQPFKWIEGMMIGFHCGRHGPFGGGDRHGGFFRGGGRHGGPFGHGVGGGRERLFYAGDIKLVILKLISEQPSYGYQIIKAMEERLAGEYTPSAGVIYPTLTLLEEEGLASATVSEKNRKVYAITPEGTAYLEEHKERLEALFERLKQTGNRFERGRSPELMEAFMNLREAVKTRVSRGKVSKEQMRKIAEAIHAAAKAIDEL